MVLYFKSTVVRPSAILSIPNQWREKIQLIRWGWPEDVVFHYEIKNDEHSPHIFLRLQKGQTIDDIPFELLTDAAQLCHAECMRDQVNNLEIVYTMVENLRRSPDMDWFGYFDDKAVRKIILKKSDSKIAERLYETRVEDEYPDFRGMYEERRAADRQDQKHHV